MALVVWNVLQSGIRVQDASCLRFGPSLEEERDVSAGPWFSLCSEPNWFFGFPGGPRLISAHQDLGKAQLGDKITPEGQVRVPFLEEAAAGKAMTLALDIGFPVTVLSQELYSTRLSPENALQRLFPLIVMPEP